MDEKRKGEIALALIKMRVKDKGPRLNHAEMKREFGNYAKDLNIPINELFEFFEIIIRELVDEAFVKD
ncbi:MAG: hypothetical protein ACKKL6_01010 [Candidatus Komeilibacteria bacterium]